MVTTRRARYNIAEVKAAADLVAEVEARTGTSGKRNAKGFTFPCPNPSHADRTPSFSVDTARARWKCFSQCDRSGDVIELVEWLDGVTTAEAITYLAEQYGVTPETGGATSKRKPKPRPQVAPAKPLPRIVGQAEENSKPFTGPDAERVLEEFLDGRKWSREVAEAVGLSVVLDRFGGPRVRFPFLRDGRTLLWQDRATKAGQLPKWLTPTGATLYPFGLELLEAFSEDPDAWPVCPIMRTPAVWLVEGPADAVTLRHYWPTMTVLGIPGAGNWQAHYAEALEGLLVVVVADNDPAGATLRASIGESLRSVALVVNLEVPEEYSDVTEWHLDYAAASSDGKSSALFMESFTARAETAAEAALWPFTSEEAGKVTP
jgi:hypothetical protein